MEGTNPQQIQFIKKEPNATGKFLLTTDGTTNEEVLNVLINRLTVLYGKLPSEETLQAINSCKNALSLLNLRTQIRVKQGVENTPLPHISGYTGEIK
jgi:hypothetical protein